MFPQNNKSSVIVILSEAIAKHTLVGKDLG